MNNSSPLLSLLDQFKAARAALIIDQEAPQGTEASISVEEVNPPAITKTDEKAAALLASQKKQKLSPVDATKAKERAAKLELASSVAPVKEDSMNVTGVPACKRPSEVCLHPINRRIREKGYTICLDCGKIPNDQPI